MKVLKFRSPDGREISVNSPDGSMPNEAQLDKLFSMSSKNSGSRTSGLPSDVQKPDIQLNPVQKVISQARGLSPVGMLPMNREEGKDIGRVALNQFQSGVNNLPISLGANLTDPVSDFRNKINEDAYQKMVTPKTQYGKKLNSEATVGQLVVPGIELAGIAKNAIAGTDFAKTIGQTAGDLFDSEKRIDLMKKFRSAVFQAKSNAIDSFGKEIASQEAQALTKDPNHGIDLTEAVSNLKNEADIEPKIKTFINSVPGLKELMADGSDVSKVGLSKLQEIQNQIQGRLPSGVFKNWNHPLSSVSDFINDIKAAKIQSFPGMSKANEAYAPVAEAFKLIKGKVSPNSLEDFMKSGFQNTEVKQAVRTLLGNDSPILKRAKNFGEIPKLAKKMGIGITAEEALRRFILKKR